MDAGLAQVLSVALVNLCFSTLAGLFFARLWLRKNTSDWRNSVLLRLDAAIPATLAVALAASLLVLWLEAASMGETSFFAAAPACQLMLSATHYGHAALVGMAALLALIAVHMVANKHNRPYDQLRALLLLVFALSKVAVSHAGEDGWFSWAAGIELLHLLGIAVWVGSVLVSGWLVLRAEVMTDADLTDMREFLNRLSLFATLALGVIMATGIFNSLRVLRPAENVLAQSYCYLLAGKIFLVLLAAALGGFNRYIGLPGLLTVTTPIARVRVLLKRVLLVLRVESLVLVLVVIAAALLSGTAPP